MRRKFVVALALAIAAGGLMPIAAQDTSQPAAAAPAGQSASRQIPLRVRLTLTRSVGDKKTSSVPYMLGVLTNAQKTSLRMGVQVPVTQTVFSRQD